MTSRFGMLAPDQAQEARTGVYQPRGPFYRFTVAGVSNAAEDVGTNEVRTPRGGAQSTDAAMTVSADFYDQHRSEFAFLGDAIAVRLGGGASAVADFVRAVRGVPALSDARTMEFVDQRPDAFRTPVNLETTVLLAVGLGVAVGAVMLCALLLRLQQRAWTTMPGFCGR